MARRESRKIASEELYDALAANDGPEKDFHIRQALQLIELDGENPSELNAE